jgi:segregation and condensation protein A
MSINNEGRYQVKINDFEGPFDILLYLVKNSKININELSISEITRHFILFINETDMVNVEETSNFILTVSILLYLKSRTLLPQEIQVEDDDEGDERREFIDNLIEYQKYKTTAQLLKKCLDEEKVLIRKESQLSIDFKDNENWEEVSIMELIIAFSKVAREMDRSIFHTLEMEEISIDDKIHEILDYVNQNQTIEFGNLFLEQRSKYVLIITFLALLELVKMKKVHILQHKLFGTIKITHREESVSGPNE